jgi:prepilin-type N-terminal cleavage/methylation domain-containing protein
MLKSYEKSTLSRKFRLNQKCGFTLLEILLVVGIIAILAGIVIIAINPSKQLATVRNSQRKSDIKQVANAITQFYIDHSYYPASTTFSTTILRTICPTGASTSPAAGFDCTNMLNLSELVPTYITAIPRDPSTTATAGYSAILVNNQPAVSAPLAELGVRVVVGNVPALSTPNVWIPLVRIGKAPYNKVVKLNSSSNAAIGEYDTGSEPYAVAVDAGGNVWVANYGSNTVSKLNGSTGATIGTYAVGSYPYSVAVDASGNVWVANMGDNTVSKLNGSTGATIGTYSVGTNPYGIAVDASGNVWVTNYTGGTVSKLNGSTGATIGTYGVGSYPYSVAVDASGNVWVVNLTGGTVSKLNGSTGATIGTFSVGSDPTGVAVDASGNVWVANYGDSTVSKLNGSTGAVLDTISISARPYFTGDFTGFALQYFVLGRR